MDVNLLTNAEKCAKNAEKFPAFLGISLLNIKQKVADLLSLIGRGEIFDQYTRHDISHIDAMLKILDWLIPANTQKIMSPADWLLMVLAVYFHDLGMLVTKREYEQRNSSAFPEYRDKILFAQSDGEDYRVKVEQAYPEFERSERFLYQEFVRHKHAERIRMWIMGKAPVQLGITNDVMEEVQRLLEPFSPQFRRDLALVCESHHLDDLDDFKKYKISEPYGNSDEETANLHYAAIILRTADLLHITSDRTPSIVYRMISPNDPLSQEEWAKQRAVTRVKSKIGRDREGKPDEIAPRDTIEVYAHFSEVDGFFGLTSYLSYTSAQIRKVYDWSKTANTFHGSRLEFPWRYIDDSNIETEGFIRETFEFTIDQAKILDLLTGHTLYNDTTIVLREMVQNSLDAIRLQQMQAPASEPGKIRIRWDSKKRVLSVEDNGTGMTQEIIERHLLKVGASRYQDADFKKRYPDFSSISRFGIGVLSAFMIADNVEVTTCHPEDEMARQISLRSVHGKYLIRLLDKQTDEVAKRLSPHGTLVKLTIRPSADISDIIATAKKWIVVPGCEVTITVDDNPAVQVGFSSPKDAVLQLLEEANIVNFDNQAESNKKRIKVEQKELNGVTLAFALEWSDFFQEWLFLEASNVLTDSDVDEDKSVLLGTCIEGIRVEFSTPGFNSQGIIAIANATGSNAPKTNVARSGLESTPERDRMIQTIYSIYCSHVKNEIQELHQNRSFSLTWATHESTYILYPLMPSYNSQPLNSNFFWDSIKELPIVLVEYDGKRQAISPANLSNEESFWMIDCMLFRSAEWLIREVPGNASLSKVFNVFHSITLQLPDGLVLCGRYMLDDGGLEDYVLANREVDIIKVYEEQRRVDLRWTMRKNLPRWIQLDQNFPPTRERERGTRGRRGRTRYIMDEPGVFNPWKHVLILQDNVDIAGLSEYIGVEAFRNIYLVPNSHLAKYLISAINQAKKSPTPKVVEGVYALFDTIYLLLTYDEEKHRLQEINEEEELIDYIRNLIDGNASLPYVMDAFKVKELCQIIKHTNIKCFNPSAWRRKD